ncbi:MAG: ribonucleotide-diphosphate reductase subunit beta [Solirubrobacteraceae bacterium MAG38_C4-C5]|nr:ribonucleotide-diphosphate reductase subunit beta [Candidatus Siliceabacter maunaloa]
MLTGYEHLLRAADRLRWDEADIDLRGDTRAWAALDEVRRAPLRRLMAGFLVAEEAVAAALHPFVAAAGDPVVRACFAAQQADEERHARFFARVADEVVGVHPHDAPRAVRDLFTRRLPDTAMALARGDATLADGVALYHLILEGVVFAAGQEALVQALGDTDLDGVRAGAARVQADERWHVGLGVRCLQDAGLAVEQLEALLARGECAARAWGLRGVDAERAAQVHRRRVALCQTGRAVSR